jgi:hypothetical protein
MSVQWHLRDTLSRELSARRLGETQFLGLIQCETQTKSLSGVCVGSDMHRIEFEGGQPCEIAGV